MKRKKMLLASLMLCVPCMLMTDPHPIDRLLTAPQTVRIAALERSLNTYIHKTYNSRDYAQKIAHDFRPLVMILQTIERLSLDEDAIPYVYNTLKLTTDKLQACELIPHTSVEYITRILPKLLRPYFRQEERCYSICTMQHCMHQMLEAKLAQHAPYRQHFDIHTKQKITHALAQVAQQVHRTIGHATYTIHRLRIALLRFLETLIQKLVWSQAYYEGTWPSVIRIAHYLERLHDCGIIDHSDDIDSLHWTLLYRLRYFISLTGSIFPQTFYEEIEDDIRTYCIPFVENTYQAVTSKRTILRDIIHLGKTKAFAYAHAGIIEAIT